MKMKTILFPLLKQRAICFVFLAILCSTNMFAMNQVDHYQRIFLPVYQKDGRLMIAIRVFKMNTIPSFLVVNPANLQTNVAAIHDFLPRGQAEKDKPGYSTHWLVTSTPYYQILNRSTAAPYPLENQGLTHTENLPPTQVLTIDLCPSSNPFEQAFFQQLVDLSVKTGKPTPVTLAISGIWLIDHPNEFNWLVKMNRELKLSITWANHTFSHLFYKDQPYSENFLLDPITNLDVELLLTEQYLLEFGETPSVFFRFPGLVSDEHLVKTIKLYGLIPLGADAWQGKITKIF